MLSSSNFQLSLFLMSTMSYLKFRTIRGTSQKWVGFGKPLLLFTSHYIAIQCLTLYMLSHLMSLERFVNVELDLEVFHFFSVTI